MTISEAGNKLTATLKQIYSPREAINITALVMEKITGLSRSERLVNKYLELNAFQQNQFTGAQMQLLQHRPVQYVLQEAWFCGLPFYVDESVLIPRPETEELVELIMQDNLPVKEEAISILDIGTGSGCIAITLKKKLSNTTVYAMDISKKALSIARKNALQNQAEIVLLQEDILDCSPGESLLRFDVIVSNPPYITQRESAEMHSNVLQYEPHIALFVPDEDPLLFYKAIADFALQNLKRGPGKLYFEINEQLGTEVAEMLAAKGFHTIQLKQDLQQKNRMVSAGLV